jgi:hypothetical protein
MKTNCFDFFMNPYFYIIQHTTSGKYYAGCKISINADSATFMTEFGYQTTSKVVRDIIKSEGLSSFKIRKIKHFSSKLETLAYENRFLLRVNAAKNINFLNKQNGGKYFYNEGGYELSSSTKQKMSKPKSPQTKEKMSLSLRQRSKDVYKKSIESRRLNNATWISEDQKLKIKNHNANYWNEANKFKHREIMLEFYKQNPISEETRKLLSKNNSGKNNKMYGKKHSEETRLKMKQAWEKRKNK